MRTSFILLIIIFLTNLVGMYNQWYLKYSWFDQVLHLSGGFFVAMLFSIYLKDHVFDKAKLKTALIIIGVVTFIGVIWEFSEYIASLTLIEPLYHIFKIKAYFIGGLDDTLSDLLMDILGAGAFTIALHFFRSRERHQVKRDS